jgi:hypothetical protein
MKVRSSLIFFMCLAVTWSCKQKGDDAGGEDSFIKSAVTSNPSLIAPVSQPLTEAEDRLISNSQNAGDFMLDMSSPFEPKDLPLHQAMSEATPAPLQGIWYMNGNPLADRTVSFANMKFINKDGKKFAYFPVFGANNYTFLGDESGEKLYTMAKDFDLIYEVTFNNDFTFGEIVPTMKIGIIRIRIPKKIVEFTMTQKSDGYFIRDSKFLGKPLPSYNFVRIFDKNKNPIPGAPEDSWNKYLASSKTIVVPKLK